MNREDIIRMAREAGFVDYELDDGTTESFDKRYERFAALVMSAECDPLTDFAIQAAEKSVDVAIALEREACAKVCESIAKDMTDLAQWGATQCANTIRARAQA